MRKKTGVTLVILIIVVVLGLIIFTPKSVISNNDVICDGLVMKATTPGVINSSRKLTQAELEEYKKILVDARKSLNILQIGNSMIYDARIILLVRQGDEEATRTMNLYYSKSADLLIVNWDGAVRYQIKNGSSLIELILSN